MPSPPPSLLLPCSYSKSQFIAHYGGVEEWITARRIMTEDDLQRLSAGAATRAPPIAPRPMSGDRVIMESDEEEESTEDSAGAEGGAIAASTGGRRARNKGRGQTFMKPARADVISNVVVGGNLRESLATHVSPMRASLAEAAFSPGGAAATKSTKSSTTTTTKKKKKKKAGTVGFGEL